MKDAFLKGRKKPTPSKTDIELKLTVLKEVIAGITYKEASKKYNIKESTIKEWRLQKKIIQELGNIDISHRAAHKSSVYHVKQI